MDFSIVAIASSVLGLLLAALLALTLRKVPASDGAELWAVAVVPLGIGSFLVGQGESLPALLLVLREPVLLTGYGLLLIGLRQYLHRSRPWALAGCVVLAALVASAAFVAAWPSQPGRIMVRQAGIAVLMTAAALTLRHVDGSLVREVRLFLQGAFGCIAALALGRFALFLLPGGWSEERLFFFHDLAGMVTTMLVIGVIAGLTLLMTSRMNEALAEVSLRDGLTGLLNRRGLEDAAASALAFARRVGRPVALLTMDLDHFRTVNERYGHPGGDEVLRQFAHLLADRFADQELVGRHGGEEFVVVLPGVDGPSALARAEHFRKAVAAHPFTVGPDPAVRITVSIGVAALSAHESWGSLLARADEAMYAAKTQGRNCSRLAPAPAEEPQGSLAGGVA